MSKDDLDDKKNEELLMLLLAILVFAGSKFGKPLFYCFRRIFNPGYEARQNEMAEEERAKLREAGFNVPASNNTVVISAPSASPQPTGSNHSASEIENDLSGH